MGAILHLTLATQLDLDADFFGVWVFWVRVGIILHLTLATQLDLRLRVKIILMLRNLIFACMSRSS